MKHSIYLVLCAVVGCGGDQFSTNLALKELDSGNFDSTTPDVLPQATGGKPGTGGRATGGAPISTGGRAPNVDAGSGGTSMGGSSQETGGSFQGTGGSFQETGGSSQTGGAGGAVVDAGCALVTHENGLGQTWQDCVPLGTYNEEQAMKACEASGAARCVDSKITSGCGGSSHVFGFDDASKIVGVWGYDGFQGGLVCWLISGPFVVGTCTGGCPSPPHAVSWN